MDRTKLYKKGQFLTGGPIAADGLFVDTRRPKLSEELHTSKMPRG